VHPETGEKGLFIGGFTRQIHGLSETESRDVIRLLQAHVTKPEHILRWSWKPGQVLVFDNRITQHYAIDNYDNQPRRLARITVAGDVPVAVDGGRSQSITGDASHYTPVAEPAAATAA
jgi:taurine dioxygenase